MRFSYSLIKQFVPGLPAKRKVVEGLNLKSFETEDLAGDAFDASLLPNRYPDCASHWGMAREAAAIFGLALKLPSGLAKVVNWPGGKGKIRVKLDEPGLVARYLAAEVDLKKIPAAPAWLKKTLIACGLRPINLIVDVMNYVMLETGQPLHAFDAEKIAGGISIRRAKRGEKITTLDDKNFSLTESDLVIADDEGPLALAGIKGGKRGEVTEETTKIVIEAANFDASLIYATSRRLGLQTDASARFARGLSPVFAEYGLARAVYLLKDLAGADVINVSDYYPKKQSPIVVSFNFSDFRNFTGVAIDKKTIGEYLARLGFRIVKEAGKNSENLLVETPFWRLDMSLPEDLAEEIVRLYGYDRVPATAPVVPLGTAVIDDSVRVKEQVRRILKESGWSEVYNYSFTEEPESRWAIDSKREKKNLEIENPIAADKRYLRSELISGLRKNLALNSRHFESVNIFEIGRVFGAKSESLHLGLASRERNKSAFLGIKGALEHLLAGLGIDAFLRPEGRRLAIESEDHHVLGFLSLGTKEKEAFAEVDIEEIIPLMSAESRYEPLSRYPSVVRDLSLFFKTPVRVADVEEAIREAGLKNLVDIELLDYLDNRHFTFRLVFRREDRTLEDGEVNKETERGVALIRDRFGADLR